MNIQTAVGPAFSKHVHFVNSEQKFWCETEFGWDQKV